MAGGGSGRQLVVGVTTELFLAGQDLLAVLDDEARRGDAVERLVTVAESGIGGLASFGAQRFQAMEAGTPEERQEATDDVLATALGELTITHTLLATAAATGEQPTEGTPDEAAPGAD